MKRQLQGQLESEDELDGTEEAGQGAAGRVHTNAPIEVVEDSEAAEFISNWLSEGHFTIRSKYYRKRKTSSNGMDGAHEGEIEDQEAAGGGGEFEFGAENGDDEVPSTSFTSTSAHSQRTALGGLQDAYGDTDADEDE